MINKPVKPIHHGLIDYCFSAVQLVGPSLLGLNRETRRIYQVLGTGFLTVNCISDTPVSPVRIMAFKDHEKADTAFLAGLSLLTVVNTIRRNKRSLFFHLGFLGLAVTHYMLTDYEA